MKKRYLQNSLVAAVLALAIGLSIGVMATSCRKGDYLTASQQRRINKKLPYLEFTTKHPNLGDIVSTEDGEVILEAMARAKISKKDGVWQMIITSPKEGNMSAEVFEYLRQAVNGTNSFNQKRKGNGSSEPFDPNRVIMIR